MKNKMSDLNNHLFAQLERLSDETLSKEQIEVEVKRGAAIVGVAEMIIENASLQIQATKLIAEHGDVAVHHLPMLEARK
jgi:hypothetical protein